MMGRRGPNAGAADAASTAARASGAASGAARAAGAVAGACLLPCQALLLMGCSSAPINV